MTDFLIPAPPSTSSPPSRRPRLLTRDQVLSALRREVESGGQGGLTAAAKRYGIKVSQISDVLKGRSKLSRRMVERLRYVMHEFFEKIEEGEERPAGKEGK